MGDKNLNDVRGWLAKSQKYFSLDGAPPVGEKEKGLLVRQIAWIDALTDEERQEPNTLRSRATWQQVTERVGKPPLGRAWIFKSLDFLRALDEFGDGGGSSNWLE
jgi:hypothetical protein